MSRFTFLLALFALPMLAAAQPKLITLAVNPNPLYGGGKGTGTVTLNQAAGAGGVNVSLNTNTSVLTIPASVNVPQGQTQATFNITVGHIGAPAVRQVRAVLNADTKTVNVNLQPGLKSIRANPETLTGGSPTRGVIELWGPAPSGGIHINVSSNSSVVIPPAMVHIDQGQSVIVFDITTGQVGANATRLIFAEVAGSKKSGVVNLTAGPRLATLSVSPNPILGSSTATGTITLTGPSTNVERLVQLSENSPNASLSSPATVNTGSSTTTFPVATSQVGAPENVTITGSQGGVTRTATLTLLPEAALKSLVVNPSTIVGGQSTTGSVTLSSAAPAGGRLVTLSDNTSALSEPPNVTVAQGATSANFQITSSVVGATVTRQVSATLNGITRTANVTLTPAAQQVSISGSEYVPKEITVAPGATIKWTNQDFLQHTVTRDRTDIDGPASPTLQLENTYEWTVPITMAKGTNVFYHCEFHGAAGNGSTFGFGMTGVIRVR